MQVRLYKRWNILKNKRRITINLGDATTEESLPQGFPHPKSEKSYDHNQERLIKYFNIIPIIKSAKTFDKKKKGLRKQGSNHSNKTLTDSSPQ